MTERRGTMDFMGILKEAWGVTRRNKRLWILGLFAGGSAGISTSNWNSSSSSNSGSKGLPPGWENIHTPSEALQRGLDMAGKQLGVPMGTAAQWWVFIGLAVFALQFGTVVVAVGAAREIPSQSHGDGAGGDLRQPGDHHHPGAEAADQCVSNPGSSVRSHQSRHARNCA